MYVSRSINQYIQRVWAVEDRFPQYLSARSSPSEQCTKGFPPFPINRTGQLKINNLEADSGSLVSPPPSEHLKPRNLYIVANNRQKVCTTLTHPPRDDGTWWSIALYSWEPWLTGPKDCATKSHNDIFVAADARRALFPFRCCSASVLCTSLIPIT